MPSLANPYLPLCNWTANIALKECRTFEESQKKSLHIPERVDCYTGSNNLGQHPHEDGSSGNESINAGEKRLKALIEHLNKLDKWYKRSSGQRKFHKAFIGACLKKIYGDEIYRNLGRLLIEYDLQELQQDVLVVSTRRYGKTMAVALYVAAYILTQPNAEISIFSTGRRASRKILALIWQMVVKLAGTPSVVVRFNEENLEVKSADGTVSRCCSYPSKVQIDKLQCLKEQFYSSFFPISPLSPPPF